MMTRFRRHQTDVGWGWVSYDYSRTLPGPTRVQKMVSAAATYADRFVSQNQKQVVSSMYLIGFIISYVAFHQSIFVNLLLRQQIDDASKMRSNNINQTSLTVCFTPLSLFVSSFQTNHHIDISSFIFIRSNTSSKTMFSAYRTSVSSIASTAGRRVLHSTMKSSKSTIDAATATPKSTVKLVAEATTKVEKSSSSGGGIMNIAKDHPFAFQLAIATGKTSAADLMCQMIAEKKKLSEVDWKRNAVFVVFGFAYLGCFQYYIQVTKYRQWFPTMDRFAKLPFAEKLKDTAGILDAGKMVLFDVIVHLPIMYFPTYYAVKEFVGGHTWNPVDWVTDGLTKYSKNAKEDLTAMIQLWGPSDCVQFVLPVHIRLPFRHVVSFFWTAYVSFTRGAIDEEPTSVVVVEES